MSIISNIRRLIRHYLLNRSIKESARVKRLVGYAEGRHVLVLYDASDNNQLTAVDNLKKTFQEDGIKADFLGYLPKNFQKPENANTDERNSLIHRKELSWKMTPSDGLMQQLLAGPFDILVDVSRERHFPVKCLAGLANASFKVGIHHDEYVNVYDLTLKVNDTYPADELARQVIHYLKILKTPATHVK